MIKKSGRTFALIDLANLVVGGRERYTVTFAPDPKAKSEAPKLFRCQADGSVWLSKDEAVKHFVNSPALKQYYGVEQVEAEPPKGNFSGIAVCGFSGTLLGPPNHHTYQENVLRLHRERFANMSLERYKQRIRTESGEEIVEKWKEENSKTTEWVYPRPAEEKAEAPTTEEELPAAPETPEAPEAAAAESTPADTPDAAPEDAGASPPEAEPAAEAASEPEAAAEAASEAEPAAEPEAAAEAQPAAGVTRLKNTAELERHIREHLAVEIIVESDSATVNGNIPGRLLSPPLLAALKPSAEHVRRSPSMLIPGLCDKLGDQGLKIFRWGGKKLYTSASRPRQLDADAPLSAGVRKIFEFVRDHPKCKPQRLLDTFAPVPAPAPEAPPAEAEAPVETPAPADPTAAAAAEPKEEAPKRPAPVDLTPEQVQVLRDLRWLVGEGFIVEFSDGRLDAVKVREKAPEPSREKSSKPKPSAAAKPEASAPEAAPGAEPAAAQQESPTSPESAETAATPSESDPSGAAEAPAPEPPAAAGSGPTPPAEVTPPQPASESTDDPAKPEA